MNPIPFGLAVCGFIAAACLVTPSTASAAGPDYDTCDGFTPTVVGSHGTVYGTRGRDIIVAGPGTTVLARGGDDYICTYGGTVKAGRGNDYVVVRPSGQKQTGKIDLGPGRGDFLAAGESTRVVLDLAEHRLSTAAGRFTVLNVDTWFITSLNRVEVRGGTGPDYVEAQGCELLMRGGRGNDRLIAAKNSNCGVTGSRFVSVLYGGAGRDFLHGTTAQDKLIGGPGHDSVNGGPGYDLCRGEGKHHCEH